jgi:predicted transposase YdaD
MFRVGVVVAGELPRDRSTILVRIMAGGAALPAALAELGELPAGACERDVASMDVLELRQVLGSKPSRSVEEEEFIVSTQNIVEKLREEGRNEGRDEGRNEGRAEGEAIARARDVLTVLRARGIAVPEAARERIVAQKSPERLERWLERAAVVASVGEVIDEPS